MKKYFLLAVIAISLIMLLAGCRQSERVSYNLSKEADNFNIVRQITVINCIQGDVLFQVSGKMSINVDETENQLELLVESDGTYSKHFIGLSDNVTYVVEDLNLGDNEVNKYRYTISFNPKMWIPLHIDSID